jgi:hypothetical protein
MTDLAEKVFEAYQEFRLAGFEDRQAFELATKFMTTMVSVSYAAQHSPKESGK